MLKISAQFALIVILAFVAVVFVTGKPLMSLMFTKIVLLIATAGVAIWHWRRVRMGLASTNWLKTKGLVLTSKMDFIEDADDDNRGYWVSIEYTYKIGLQLFKSSRLTFDKTTHLTLDEANRLLSGVQNGCEIDVYYSPADKSQSVIIPGASAKCKWLLALWLMLFVVALVIVKLWQPS